MTANIPARLDRLVAEAQAIRSSLAPAPTGDPAAWQVGQVLEQPITSDELDALVAALAAAPDGVQLTDRDGDVWVRNAGVWNLGDDRRRAHNPAQIARHAPLEVTAPRRLDGGVLTPTGEHLDPAVLGPIIPSHEAQRLGSKLAPRLLDSGEAPAPTVDAVELAEGESVLRPGDRVDGDVELVARQLDRLDVGARVRDRDGSEWTRDVDGWRLTLSPSRAAVVAEYAPLEVLPCPTCSGPIRHTVGMVCQTCGTDYGATTETTTPTVDVDDPVSRLTAECARMSGEWTREVAGLHAQLADARRELDELRGELREADDRSSKFYAQWIEAATDRDLRADERGLALQRVGRMRADREAARAAATRQRRIVRDLTRGLHALADDTNALDNATDVAERIREVIATVTAEHGGPEPEQPEPDTDASGAPVDEVPTPAPGDAASMRANAVTAAAHHLGHNVLRIRDAVVEHEQIDVTGTLRVTVRYDYLPGDEVTL